MISSAQFFAIIFSLVISVGFPLTLLIVWRKKTHAPLSDAGCGALIFLVFAMVLEQISHVLFLRPDGYVLNHTWAYVLYGAFAAGIFEETGRFVAFKVFLKKHRKQASGVLYGIGHGGMESVLLCGTTMVLYLVIAFQINGAAGDLTALPKALQPMTASLQGMTVGTLLMSGVERMIAVCFHISLSVLVFWAVNRPGKWWLYPAAILLHAGLDMIATLYQRGVLENIYLMEVLIGLFTAVVCVLVGRAYKQQQAAAEPDDAGEIVEISQKHV